MGKIQLIQERMGDILQQMALEQERDFSLYPWYYFQVLGADWSLECASQVNKSPQVYCLG